MPFSEGSSKTTLVLYGVAAQDRVGDNSADSYCLVLTLLSYVEQRKPSMNCPYEDEAVVRSYPRLGNEPHSAQSEAAIAHNVQLCSAESSSPVHDLLDPWVLDLYFLAVFS